MYTPRLPTRIRLRWSAGALLLSRGLVRGQGYLGGLSGVPLCRSRPTELPHGDNLATH